MDKEPTFQEILLIGIPLEWRTAMMPSLENAKFVPRFSMSKGEAIHVIRARELSAIVVTSDFVFADDLNQDVIALAYGQIPTLTIIFEETIQEFGQERVFEKVYNPEGFQDFCTTPFAMDELLTRLQNIIQKAHARL